LAIKVIGINNIKSNRNVENIGPFTTKVSDNLEKPTKVAKDLDKSCEIVINQEERIIKYNNERLVYKITVNDIPIKKIIT